MIHYLRKVIQSVRTFGFRTTLRRIRNRLFGVRTKKLDTGFILTSETRRQQSGHAFSKQVFISILVPLYNTPQTYLREMIASALNQTYGNWELCLADASTGTLATDVQVICQEYAARDQRIKYQRLSENEGIAGNTNRCLEMATGDYFALLDHDDVLHPSALFEVMRAICEQDADMIYTDEITFTDDPRKGHNPHFKPNFSPDTLRSYNYITHLTVFSRHLQEEVGGLRSQFDGSQDYDLILRLTEKAQKIVHIPKILYYWRAHPQSVAAGIEAKTYAIDAAKLAISEHLQRVGLPGKVTDAAIPTVYRIDYQLTGTPLVSIIIPNKDHMLDLDTCLRSIAGKTSYPNYQVLIVENNSAEEQTFKYYDALKRTSAAAREGAELKDTKLTLPEIKDLKVLHYQDSFNFSAINNFAAKQAEGEFLLFLNNDAEVITPGWIEELLMFAQRPDVGVVGAKLYYPDETIQHAGVIVGIGGVAGHSHKNFRRNDFGYVSRLQLAQNVSAVTAACLMVKKSLFEELSGFDPSYPIAFNDVDFCMRVREAGYLNIFTPFAELYHHESKSRGIEDTVEKQQRFLGEVHRFKERWKAELEAGDPYYNPNLSLEREDFSLRISDTDHTRSTEVH